MLGRLRPGPAGSCLFEGKRLFATYEVGPDSGAQPTRPWWRSGDVVDRVGRRLFS
jgi:hypothetical protein